MTLIFPYRTNNIPLQHPPPRAYCHRMPVSEQRIAANRTPHDPIVAREAILAGVATGATSRPNSSCDSMRHGDNSPQPELTDRYQSCFDDRHHAVLGIPIRIRPKKNLGAPEIPILKKTKENKKRKSHLKATESHSRATQGPPKSHFKPILPPQARILPVSVARKREKTAENNARATRSHVVCRKQRTCRERRTHASQPSNPPKPPSNPCKPPSNPRRRGDSRSGRLLRSPVTKRTLPILRAAQTVCCILFFGAMRQGNCPLRTASCLARWLSAQMSGQQPIPPVTHKNLYNMLSASVRASEVYSMIRSISTMAGLTYVE